tara:strand:+ start:3316 stop:4029 length:714 start_codon:yes stop_codon:yes gene_type:complete
MNKDKLKSMIYDFPDNDHFDLMSRKTNLIEISPDDIEISSPPENDSRKTKSEINHIKRALKDLKPGESIFVDLADKKMMSLFKSEADKNNVYFDEDFFYDLKEDLRGFILNLKFRFNRPRPRQVAKAVGVDLPYLETDTTGSPSYPSGHTIQAFAIANVLGSMYPGLREKFRNLAERISLSRVQAGVHFPSDIDAGIKVADAIEPYVLEPGDAPGDRRNYNLRSATRKFISDLDFPG